MRILFFLLFISATLFAHKLNLFLDFKDEKLFIYSYFNSGAPCKNCKVELLNKDDKLVKTLQTDENGEYLLADYKNISCIRVEAFGGHATRGKIDIQNKEEETPITKEDSFLESIIAIILIILIFLGLKRVKK